MGMIAKERTINPKDDTVKYNRFYYPNIPFKM